MSDASEVFDRAYAARRAFRPQSTVMAKWLKKHKSLLIYCVLIIGGVALNFWHLPLSVAWQWLDETRELFGHALIVAGLLGGTVDTLLKAALIRDVGSLFVGWALPQEIRHYIRHVSQTSLVRRNYHIHYALRIEDSDTVLDVTNDCDVFNYSNGIRKYRPQMAVDKMENPDESAIALEITKGATSKRWTAAQLNAPKKRDVTAQLIRWRSPKAYLLFPQEPEDLIPACHTRWTYRIRVPSNFSTVASFGTPTIGVTVTCDCPPGMVFECKESDEVTTRIRQQPMGYPALFFNSHLRVTGDQRSQVRWKRSARSQPSPSASRINVANEGFSLPSSNSLMKR